ncbi:MAG: hypothetical protein ACKPB3_10075 [Bacteroidota bacterium]
MRRKVGGADGGGGWRRAGGGGREAEGVPITVAVAVTVPRSGSPITIGLAQGGTCNFLLATCHLKRGLIRKSGTAAKIPR